jgi:hypothetical protein
VDPEDTVDIPKMQDGGWFSTGYFMVEVNIVVLPYFSATWRG